jgi:hypothetical protein
MEEKKSCKGGGVANIAAQTQQAQKEKEEKCRSGIDMNSLWPACSRMRTFTCANMWNFTCRLAQRRSSLATI